MNASVFAGTTIDPSALVQKLDVDARSSASIRRGGSGQDGPQGWAPGPLPRARGHGSEQAAGVPVHFEEICFISGKF